MTNLSTAPELQGRGAVVKKEKEKKKGSSKRKTCGGEIERNADGVFGSVSVSVCCFQRLLMMFNLLIPTNS